MNLSFSQKTTDLIFDVQDFAGRRISHITPVSILIELTYTSGNQEVFRDLLFKAKYLKGLKNISKKEITGKDIDTKAAGEKIVTEISKEIENLKIIIKNIISNLPEQSKAEFDNNFFLLDSNCLLKYFELIDDLSLFKEYFNANS